MHNNYCYFHSCDQWMKWSTYCSSESPETLTTHSFTFLFIYFMTNILVRKTFQTVFQALSPHSTLNVILLYLIGKRRKFISLFSAPYFESFKSRLDNYNSYSAPICFSLFEWKHPSWNWSSRRSPYHGEMWCKIIFLRQG